MADDRHPGTGTVLAGLNQIADQLGWLYKDLHAHPELSFAEHRTARVVADYLTRVGFDVTTGVGQTGVVGVLRNGAGPTVLLRADFDALPVQEDTGLPYASSAIGVDPDGQQVPVMHACGHDMHVACLLGALDLLISNQGAWSGAILAVFQPAEELGAGARAMVEDGLFDRFGRPDVALGQHVAPVPAGLVGAGLGPTFAASDGLRIRLFGRGAHGSRPETACDPVVMAAATVMRLQTIVSREIAATDVAVVTIGALHAGAKDNIIPDEAELRVNTRTYTEPVRTRVLDAVRRIVNAEAAAAGADREPEIAHLLALPVLFNDPAATTRTLDALRAQFGSHRVIDPGLITGSEDFGILATAAGVPACFWLFGGADAEAYAAAMRDGTLDRDIPSNHSPHFAPVIEPTLSTGVTAMVTAALTWLGTAETHAASSTVPPLAAVPARATPP